MTVDEQVSERFVACSRCCLMYFVQVTNRPCLENAVCRVLSPALPGLAAGHTIMAWP